LKKEPEKPGTKTNPFGFGVTSPLSPAPVDQSKGAETKKQFSFGLPGTASSSITFSAPSFSFTPTEPKKDTDLKKEPIQFGFESAKQPSKSGPEKPSENKDAKVIQFGFEPVKPLSKSGPEKPSENKDAKVIKFGFEPVKQTPKAGSLPEKSSKSEPEESDEEEDSKEEMRLLN
jgi:hypothetical protein